MRRGSRITSRQSERPANTTGIERLFARNAGWLLLYARSLQFEDPEAAVQEAFLNLWVRLEAGAVIEDAAAYLAAVVRNAATRESRGNRIRLTTATEPDWFAETRSSEHDHSNIAAGWAGSTRQVQQAVQALPEEQRDVVVLKIWGTLTFDQIAWALGIPMNTAASRFRYALQKLKHALEGKQDSEARSGVLNHDPG